LFVHIIPLLCYPSWSWSEAQFAIKVNKLDPLRRAPKPPPTLKTTISSRHCGVDHNLIIFSTSVIALVHTLRGTPCLIVVRISLHSADSTHQTSGKHLLLWGRATGPSCIKMAYNRLGMCISSPPSQYSGPHPLAPAAHRLDDIGKSAAIVASTQLMQSAIFVCLLHC